jgi:ABC-type enterochelin transport system substrate-binding protein
VNQIPKDMVQGDVGLLDAVDALGLDDEAMVE